jgi:hypothetical protein
MTGTNRTRATTPPRPPSSPPCVMSVFTLECTHPSFLRLEHDRDGSVVHERHLHARAEDAARNAETGALERAAEALVKGLGEVRAGSRSEARTIPLSCVLLTSERNRRMETR